MALGFPAEGGRLAVIDKEAGGGDIPAAILILASDGASSIAVATFCPFARHYLPEFAHLPEALGNRDLCVF